MSDGALAGIVIAGHGGFAAGVRDALQCVAGAQERIATVSNHGLDAAGIEAAMFAAVEAVHADVIFTDLPAGSCTIGARRVAKQRPAISVVTGANLPMLLDHLLKGRVGGEGATLAAAKGRDAIAVYAAAPQPSDEEGSHGR